MHELTEAGIPKPQDRRLWTVRLGRLALQQDGHWAYLGRLQFAMSKRNRSRIKKQRFGSLDEAIRVATKVLGTAGTLRHRRHRPGAEGRLTMAFPEGRDACPDRTEGI